MVKEPRPGPHSAFFYGTLMAPSVLARVTSAPLSTLHIRPAILPQHRRHRVRYADYPGVVPAGPPSSSVSSPPSAAYIPSTARTSVRGTHVSGLTDRDLWRLGLFEGDDYTRRRVRVKVLPKDLQHKANADTLPAFLRTSSSCQSDSTNADLPGQMAGGICEAAVAEDEKEMQELDTETYIWTGPREDLEDEEWDFDQFVREKLRFWARGDEGGDEGFRIVEEAVAAEEQGVVDGSDGTGGRSVHTGEFEKRVAEL